MPHSPLHLSCTSQARIGKPSNVNLNSERFKFTLFTRLAPSLALDFRRYRFTRVQYFISNSSSPYRQPGRLRYHRKSSACLGMPMTPGTLYKVIQLGASSLFISAGASIKVYRLAAAREPILSCLATQNETEQESSWGTVFFLFCLGKIFRHFALGRCVINLRKLETYKLIFARIVQHGVLL
jgi:hypothetical protein